MAFKNSLTFEVSRTPSADALSRLARACTEAAPRIPSPSAPVLQVVTNLHSEKDINLGPPSERDAYVAPVQKLVDRMSADPYERLERIASMWPQIGNEKPPHLVVLEDLEQQHAWKITYNGPPNKSDQTKAIIDALRSVFTPVEPAVERFKSLPTELRQFHLDQERVFSNREAELLKGHGELRTAVLNAEKSAQLRIENERAKFDAERDDLREQYKKRDEEIDARDRELRDEKAAIDDRAHTHVRRQHEKTVQEMLTKHRKFEPSDATRMKRALIHALCLTVIGGAGTLYGFGLSFQDETEQWDPRAVSVMVTAALLFGSTLVFYLRWMNHWFRSAAQAELAARAFEEDFTRAYWLVELLFEWEKDHPKQCFPPELLSSLSHSLFDVSRETSGAAPDHPVAELLGKLPSVKEVSIGGGWGRNDLKVVTEGKKAD